MDERLPEGWVWTAIDNVVRPERIVAYPKENSTLPFIGLEHVEAETMRLIGTSLSHGLKSNALRFLSGDVLYGRLRPYLNKVLRPEFEGLCSAEFLVFHESANLDSHYLQYFLNSWVFKEFSSHQITGDRPRVDWDQLKFFNFPLPPRNEQTRIVAAIEKQFTRLDEAVASLKSAQAKMGQYRASLLKAAVEGELTRAWCEEHEVSETGEQLLARILAERRARWEEEQLAKMREKGSVPKDEQWKKAYKEPQGPNVEGLGELPEGWCWATVEQVAQIQGGIQKQPSRVPQKNAYPYLRVANVFRGKLDLSVIEKMELFGDELDTLRLEIGDLLIVEGNGSKTEIGRSALWSGEIKNCVHQNHIIRVRLNHVVPKYVDFYWNSPAGNKRVMDIAASTTGLYTLSVGKISKLPIPLPPLAEQAQIVAEVEARLSDMAQLEKEIERNLQRAEQMRQSILREAFAGRLVEQDARDEPASVLLERMREERRKREEMAHVAQVSRKKGVMDIKKNAGRVH